jgi:hypothetical protein
MNGTKSHVNASPSDGFSPPTRRTLLELLGRLLIQIDRVMDDGATPGQGDRQADRWEDEAYLYIEAAFPQGLDWAADLSVLDGKVFMRIEK